LWDIQTSSGQFSWVWSRIRTIQRPGLLSYVYADLDKDDPRVKAVYERLSRNYTLDENPGMGPEGLYYYYHKGNKNMNEIKGKGGIVSPKTAKELAEAGRGAGPDRWGARSASFSVH
jgi:hypothetical protein